eukprot:8213342-Pyramimonas_sp.AAC.1
MAAAAPWTPPKVCHQFGHRGLRALPGKPEERGAVARRGRALCEAAPGAHRRRRCQCDARA